MRPIPGFVLGFAIVVILAIALKLAADHLDRTVPLPERPANHHAMQEQ